MNAVDEAQSLQNLMQKIRDRRSKRVGELQLEAQRLVDWKEYVRSAPVASVLGSVAAGFLAVNAFKQTLSKQQAPVLNPGQTPPVAVTGYNFQWAVSMLSPIVMNAARKYLMQTLSTVMQGSSNENKSSSQTAPERPAYSE